MITRTICRCCERPYELIWSEDLDLSTEFESESDEVWLDDVDEDDDLEPVYCPFCGTHRDYDED